MSRLLCTIIILAVSVCTASSVTISVPADQPTIQAAIDVATDGDTVLISAGVYAGDGNRDIDVGGKAISVVGQGGWDATIMNCGSAPEAEHSGFLLDDEESAALLIRGLTIENGRFGIKCDTSSCTVRMCNLQFNGMAIVIHNGSPVIDSCRISHNDRGVTASGGPGRSAPKVLNCEITNQSGDGIVLSECSFNESQVANCLIAYNGGYGLKMYYINPWNIQNCTVVGNETGMYAIGIYPKTDSAKSAMPPYISHCIIAFNRRIGVELEVFAFEQVRFYASNVYGNPQGDLVSDFLWAETISCISEDSRFCDTTSGNYQLQDNSPCLPENNSTGELIGAFGLGCYCCAMRGDLDDDGERNVADLTYLVGYLFLGGPSADCPEHADVDGQSPIDSPPVSVSDLTYLVAYLFQGGPAPVPCN